MRTYQRAGTLYPAMGLSKKRRLHIEQMTARSLDSCKHQKIDLETQRKKEILRRQREEED